MITGMLGFANIISPAAMAASTVLGIPLYVQACFVVEEEVIVMLLSRSELWIYAAIVLAHAVLAARLLGDLRMVHPIALEVPGLTLLSLMDAVRSDAYYFRRFIFICTIAAAAIYLEVWVLLVMGELRLSGDPLEWRVNMTSFYALVNATGSCNSKMRPIAAASAEQPRRRGW